ncbi:Gfo/Idh/MocA family oxidoreductase [Microbacterium sp. CFBP9034]|uniref:Gfo/Idh/MocA family protein n=1 Tax=Microbacterium sp. CFBP9034 TaxID=3096540 RepID=UPI002A69937E|nr:Gfo/Idh/MocA family oxidoreductase [Microbacterium sp. CFBP9034]MDY0908571.1 Gfo/Idh/MocA family oxidoreductase [Microbacterium sp. CFBP9034]
MPSLHRRPSRVAIIGTGGIAHAHAEAVRELGDKAELVAVADIDENRARGFAEQFGAERFYTDAAVLLASESLDLVHICTPPKSHVPLALLAQRAGVPALVEKPIALSLEEIDRLVASEERTGVPVLTVFQHRFGEPALRLRRLADSGVLGRAQVATCETLWYRADEYFEVPWRGRWEVEGGGPTMGHGIHQFDLLLAVLGPWSRVSAFAARRSRPTDTEDVSIALAEFENGALATVVNSVVSPRETSRLRFDYEFATVEVEHLYGYTERDWTFTPAPGHEELARLWDGDGDEISGHRLQIEAVLDALADGERPGVGIDESRRTLEFAAATYASAFRGLPVGAGEIDRDDPFFRSMDGGAVPWARVKEVVA